MSLVEEEIKEMISYCQWKMQDTGTMSAFDVFDEMAERLGYLLNTVRDEAQSDIDPHDRM